MSSGVIAAPAPGEGRHPFDVALEKARAAASMPVLRDGSVVSIPTRGRNGKVRGHIRIQVRYGTPQPGEQESLAASLGKYLGGVIRDARAARERGAAGVVDETGANQNPLDTALLACVVAGLERMAEQQQKEAKAVGAAL